jgi:hypothetical protein
VKEEIQNHFQGNYHQFYEKYLVNVKKIGGQEYQAICPFHDDKRPSFNFNNETGAYFCHGCAKKGGIFHFYAKTHSLDDRKDFPKVLNGIASDFGITIEQEKSRLIKTYDYTDQEGNLLFQVCRYEPKDFKQRRPNGNGGWKWDLKGIQTVLYHLPDVLKSEEVFIVEGEKDADNVVALGFCATTCPMGAKKWRDHYNEFLKGKDLILCPDNDQEGREHMTQVAISLNGTPRSLKWIDFPDLPSKGDISDWITKFDSPETATERLAILIENAEPYSPPKKTTLEDLIMTTQEFLSLDIPPRQAYLYPWLREDSITLATGERGIGKSFLAHGIANAITKGESFGPWTCNLPAPVLILDGEMPATDLQERIEALHLNSDRSCPLYLYSDALANQHGLPRAHLANESWREKMKSILLARHIKLWIVDNLASLAGGLDENLKKEWDPINTWLLELRFAGIATILLHHTNKEGLQRGTSAREDNIDVSIMLKKPSDYTAEDGCRFIVSFTKARVSLAALPLIGETEFKLNQNESGEYSWTWQNVKRERKKEILRMLDEGMEYDAIIKALGITKGYISRIRKDAFGQGFITSNGKITDTGRAYVGKD